MIKEGDQIKYIGKGFIGYDKNKPVAIFIECVGNHDARINYNGNTVLVYKHEIQKLEVR